jgi:hypothetical protein
VRAPVLLVVGRCPGRAACRQFVPDLSCTIDAPLAHTVDLPARRLGQSGEQLVDNLSDDLFGEAEVAEGLGYAVSLIG